MEIPKISISRVVVYVSLIHYFLNDYPKPRAQKNPTQNPPAEL